MGIQQALLGAKSSGYQASLAAGTVTAAGTPGDSGSGAYLVIGSNGTIDVVAAGSSIADHSWYTPTTAGIGSGKYVRATHVSGDTLAEPTDYLFGNVVGTWVSLLTDRYIGFYDSSTTTGTAVYDVQIATDSGGSNIVCTGRYTFVRS